MDVEFIKKNLREVPDFPKKGILFYDVCTVYRNPECFTKIMDELYEQYKDKGITKVVGIESRGFVFGAALAHRLNAGFVMCRKPGKLPAETIEVSYAKEYGMDKIQLHKDAIHEGDVVLIHDDLLATGGTMVAAEKLVEMCKAKKIYINFIIELKELGGREKLKNTNLSTLIQL